MVAIPKQVEELLELDLIQSDGSVKFTPESILLIQELAEKWAEDLDDPDTKEKSEEYAEGLSAEDVYRDMLGKIANAPTRIHAVCTLRYLMPILAQKLKSGERETSRPEKIPERIVGQPFRWGGLERAFDRTAKEWAELDPSGTYEHCRLCKRPFEPDAHLYVGHFQRGSMSSLKLLCKECAYSFGEVIEP